MFRQACNSCVGNFAMIGDGNVARTRDFTVSTHCCIALMLNIRIQAFRRDVCNGFACYFAMIGDGDVARTRDFTIST